MNVPDLWNNNNLNCVKESNRWANAETFDISIQAVKESAKKNYNAINSKIQAFERTAKDVISAHIVGGNSPSNEKIRLELAKIFKPSKIQSGNIEEETTIELFPFIRPNSKH